MTVTAPIYLYGNINIGNCIEDVVVSAPSEGKYEQKNPKRSDLDTFYMKEYTGKVYVFLGKENQEINNDISPDKYEELRDVLFKRIRERILYIISIQILQT